jgi:hypothetical protein
MGLIGNIVVNSYANVVRVRQFVSLVLAAARDSPKDSLEKRIPSRKKKSGINSAAWMCAAGRGVVADSPALFCHSEALAEEGKRGRPPSKI